MKIIMLLVTTLLAQTVSAGDEIRKDSIGHLHTPKGVYKQNALGQWRNADGDTYRKNSLGQWTNNGRTFRENPLGQKTDGEVTIREKFVEDKWEVK